MRVPALPTRILLVDADPATLDVSRWPWTSMGTRSWAASNGMDGLARVQETRPDLVIVD